MAGNGNRGGGRVSQDHLRQELAERAGQPLAPASPAKTVADYLKRMGPEIARALPRHMDPGRLARVALTTIRMNPRLMECSVPSLMGAIMQAAQLGLEPGILGHCSLVPFRNKKTQQLEVQFMIGYRGMIDLARRSGNVQSIYAQVVFVNDHFKLIYGLNDTLEHIPWHLREDESYEEPGEIRGFYMVAKFKDGGYLIHYMSKAEVDEHRDRSQASDKGPWVTDYIEMGKKTAIRSGWKWLPISVELMAAVARDETVTSDPTKDFGDLIDTPVVIRDLDDMAQESAPPADNQATGGPAPGEQTQLPLTP